MNYPLSERQKEAAKRRRKIKRVEKIVTGTAIFFTVFASLLVLSLLVLLVIGVGKWVL